jgi:hypothetical protein
MKKDVGQYVEGTGRDLLHLVIGTKRNSKTSVMIAGSQNEIRKQDLRIKYFNFQPFN